MSGFISALIKQRKDAKEAEPDTNGRLKEILTILKKQNYDDGFTPEVIVNILQDLGPTFVKIGQIASQQTAYIPKEYVEALAKLRSKVAPMDMDTVKEQIKKYLGKPVDKLYKSFDEKPLGSASIAQVHKAVLFDGTKVAVKVRRPGIVDTVARDFALIEKVLDKFLKPEKDSLNIKGIVEELEKTSTIELDLTNEADNLDRFWENNQGREKIESPKCYRELTCEAVLTESFVTGKEVSDTKFIETLSEEERERLANLVADNFATQILTDGFYHADPHSGNVLIKAAEGLPEHAIEWIDFGMMGTLTSQQRQLLIDMVKSVMMKDAYALKKIVLQVAEPRGEINHGELLQLCENMCDQYGSGFEDKGLGDLMDSILDALKKQNYKVDPFLSNLARGIIAIEGTVKAINPKVSILQYFMDKVDIGIDVGSITEDKVKEMTPEIIMKLLQYLKGVTESATKTSNTLDMLEKGQIMVKTDFSLEEKTQELVKRLARYAIRGAIVVALIIASSILCTATAYILKGTGIVGFVLSLFFGQRLYRDMKKDK